MRLCRGAAFVIAFVGYTPPVPDSLPSYAYLSGDAAEWLAKLPDRRVYICGDGAVRYRSFVNRPNWLFYDMDLYLAVTMAQLAASTRRGPLEPLYVRKTDAETALEARNDSVASPGPKS